MKSRLILAAAALLASAAAADAATATLSIIINSSPSATIACTPPPTLTAPLAVGAVVCPITITPAGWSGAIALSGTNASSFALAGSNLVVGAAALPAGAYSVTLTSTP
jgi:opacity protein-like surface antigen